MECCEVEPRYTIEQIDLLQRLRLSGMSKPQIIHALESLERLDPEHRPSHCDSHSAPSNNNTPTTAAPAPSSSSSSSASSLSLASATTQTSGLDGAALSPSHSYEASPPPLYPPSVPVQRSFSYDMLGDEEWDLEEKVEEYMRSVCRICTSYISQWLLQQGLEMSDSKRRAFYRWYLLERNNPGLRWSESQHSVSPMARAREGGRDGMVAGASGSLPNPNTNLNPNPVWSRQRELLMHLLPWYTAAAAAAHAQPALSLPLLPPSGATLSMRSLVKEEPDWRTGIMSTDRTGIVGGPLRLRRGSRFTWRKECQTIMESFFVENQYPDEAKREEIASTCNSVIQKPGCKLSEFERVTALKVYNWFANRRKEMKRRANIEAAILESHGIEVPSPSCHSNGEEGEMQEFGDQVSCPLSHQISSKMVDQQDTPTMINTELAVMSNPTSQALEQKEEDSKRETVDEE
uniref:Zgc:91944 n=1 Tax=Cynoglossus semilaevis TaxID=244447 RepID=A0A3P8W743_CYNSE